MEEINNFQQEPDETLYQACEQFKELLMKCPQHYLTEMQEVILFYIGLDVQTRQILDSKGAIPSKTASDAKVAIQEMNVTFMTRSTKTFDGLAAIQAQLNNIGREIKKVNEKKTMDHYTKKALWIYWIRGDDEVELTDEESSNSDGEDEVAEIFRIETNVFDFETPLSYIVGNILRYQDLEWYDALKDSQLKEEALKNKAIMEVMIDNNDESNEKIHELCDDVTQELLVWTIRRFKMIKYSFGQDEKYVAVKEDEYEDLTSTSEDACQAYQEIFRTMDEGWMVTRIE
ncbi:hypothetical protein Tco_1400561 [Tanacetum coccineum]